MFKNTNFDKITGRYSFEIHDVDLAIVNGLRRVILCEIPILGFRGEPIDNVSVNISLNTGPLHNDFMIHRIGMIPIHYSSDQIENPIDALETKFILNVKNSAELTRNITTHDFIIENRPNSSAEIAKLFPVNPITNMPVLITRLRKGEEINLVAKPVKSNGHELASFSPVSMCTLSFIVDPKRADLVSNVLDKERAFYRNAFGEPTSFKFELESETGLSAKYIVDKAISILLDKIEMVINEVRNADSEKVTITEKEVDKSKDEQIVKCVEYTFNKEDDTLGNILQSLMHNKYIRTNDKDIEYVGYLCPHPLEPRMLLNIRGKFNNVQQYNDVLIGSCIEIKKTLDEIRNNWVAFA